MWRKNQETCTDEVNPWVSGERLPQFAMTSSKVINTGTATSLAGRARSTEQNANHTRNQVSTEVGLSLLAALLAVPRFASLK